MKKLMTLAAVVLCAFLVACGGGNTPTTQTSGTPTEPSPSSGLKVAGLRGPTAMGIVKLMQDNTANTYQVLGTPEEAAAKITSGEVDIALLPANVAANLYNKGTAIQLLGINTLGVQYVVETGDSIKSIQDLKGKTVYSTGKGATPEYALNFILEKNGIDPEKDVKIEYKSEATELAQFLETKENAIAILPQPYMSTVMNKNPKVKTALNLNDEWKKVDSQSDIVTGVVVVREQVLQSNKENVDRFMKEYEASVKWVNGNHEQAGVLIEKAGIAPAQVAQKAIPQCNIVLLTGEDMVSRITPYYQALFDQNPKVIGGKMPADAFYMTSSN